MHWIFPLHYAREFYGASGDKHAGGLLFPGKEEPDYWDFLYYSLVVAMTAQVSDVQITSKAIRRLTTVHGVASFFLNVTVLALTVNIRLLGPVADLKYLYRLASHLSLPLRKR